MNRNFKTLTLVDAVKNLKDEKPTKEDFEKALRVSGSLKKSTAERWIDDFVELGLIEITEKDEVIIKNREELLDDLYLF